MLTKRIHKTEIRQEQQTPHQKEVRKKQTVTSRNSGENFLNLIVVLCKANLSGEKKKKNTFSYNYHEANCYTFFLRRIFVTLEKEIKRLSFLKMGNRDTNVKHKTRVKFEHAFVSILTWTTKLVQYHQINLKQPWGFQVL